MKDEIRGNVFRRRLWVAGRLAAFLIFHLSSFIFSATAQDLNMRRSNSIGAWLAQVNNNGVLFNQTDSSNPLPGGWGGLWTDPANLQDTLVFGAGLWVGGKRSYGGVLTPQVEYAYSPSGTSFSEFVPGSLIYDGARIDSSQAGRDKYRVYRSTDVVGPPWPLRLVGGSPTYIDDPMQRVSAGPKAILSDEDMFIVYKDSDPGAYADTNFRPFGFEVRSQLCFWKRGLLKDVVFVHSQLLYRGKDTIFDPVVGLCIDGDIQYRGDDQVRTVRSEGSQSVVFYSDSSTTDPLLGVMALPASGGGSRQPLAVMTIRFWDWGDDPSSDSDRYARLSERGIARSTMHAGDARALIAMGSHQPLAPGDTLQYDFAMYGFPGNGPALTPQDTLQMVRIADELASRYYTHTLQDAVPTKQSSSPELTISPNPADAVAYVRAENPDVFLAEAPSQLQLFNAAGEQVETITMKDGVASLSVKSLPSGLYFLRLGNSRSKIVILH